MRKIPEHLENPYDNCMIDIVEKSVDLFYNIGFTPNGITTLSLITGLASVYNFEKENFYMSAFMYALSYFFDCMDGNMARKYDMCTEFGDEYDHGKDILVNAMLLYQMVKYYWNHGGPFMYVLPVAIGASLWGSFIQLSCQEVYYNNPTKTLDLLPSCPTSSSHNVEHIMSYTRHCGTGTSVLVILIFIVLADVLKNNG